MYRLHADCYLNDNFEFIKTIVRVRCGGGFEEFHSRWAHHYIRITSYLL